MRLPARRKDSWPQVPVPGMKTNGFMARLAGGWVHGGGLAGLLLLAIAPLLSEPWTDAQVLTFLLLPAYMLHQVEEHDNDRFRRFFNREIGKGREVLTATDVLVINVPGVWGILAGSLWLAHLAGPGWGLIGVWLVLVNALAHVVQAMVMRRSNPGLVTAVLVFLPLGLFALVRLAPLAGAPVHASALAIAVAVHALILLRVRAAREAPQ